MKPCWGLANLTGVIIIAIVQILLCTVLCATYTLGLKLLLSEKNEISTSLENEPEKDFVNSLWLNDSNPGNVYVVSILYVILYAVKVLLAIGLLGVIYMDLGRGVQTILILEIVMFVFSLSFFTISWLIMDATETGTIMFYTFFLLSEIFCIFVIYQLFRDMSKPSWKIREEYPKGLRIHSRHSRIYENSQFLRSYSH